jgi:phosphohistidine phosphatase
MKSSNTPQLILWRHAEAEDGAPDLKRQLTTRGHAQARRMAAWLRSRLPEGARIVCSPAVRTLETARALTDDFETLAELGPGHGAADLLAAIGWPHRAGAVVVVGHQPTLGYVASLLVAGTESDWSIKKGAVWWIAGRARGDESDNVVRAVMSPDLAKD